jgi:hypothetical protein
MINPTGSTATRIIDVAGEPPRAAATTASLQPEPVTRSSVGKNTVMRMLSEQRQATSRLGIYALAGILIVIGAVAGMVYYKTQTDVAEQSAKLAEHSAKVEEQYGKIQQQQATVPDLVRQQLGANALEVAEKYGNATVLISMQWRLYDRQTGKPLFHKTFGYHREFVPAYVKWKGSLHRWLITEDEGHTNYRVGSSGKATGFVISDQGLILANKHVAEGWLIN